MVFALVLSWREQQPRSGARPQLERVAATLRRSSSAGENSSHAQALVLSWREQQPRKGARPQLERVAATLRRSSSAGENSSHAQVLVYHRAVLDLDRCCIAGIVFTWVALGPAIGYFQ